MGFVVQLGKETSKGNRVWFSVDSLKYESAKEARVVPDPGISNI